MEFAASFTETFMEFGVNKGGRNTNANARVAQARSGTWDLFKNSVTRGKPLVPY